MDIVNFRFLTNISTEICNEKDQVKKGKLVAEYLCLYKKDYFVALIDQEQPKNILFRSKEKKIDIDWFFEGKCDFEHMYSKKKYGYCIPGDIIVYIETKLAFDEEELLLFVLLRNILYCNRAKKRSRRQTTTKKLILKRENLKYSYENIIGKSQPLIYLLSKLDKIIQANVPVLIQGESGTGKELIARAIHKYSSRKNKRFVGENCAAITETLLESELFGHVKGAFTGAIQNHEGLFEVADKGTLFLDEIGDMSMNMQKKLLRALQNGEIRQVGGKTIKHVDVRVVAATNKNLQEEVIAKNFREDLFYRLNVVTIELPPLRERGDDILLLFNFFLQYFSAEMNMEVKPVDEKVKKLLLKYHWPGNIRELQNEVRRMIALSDESINIDVVSTSIKEVK